MSGSTRYAPTTPQPVHGKANHMTSTDRQPLTGRGCPGFEREYQGESDAKRRLANCKHCGKPRTAHANAA